MGRAERVRGTAGVAPRSWLVDPFAPTTRLRWWAGEAWTAWVVGGQSRDPYIAWLPELAELSPPSNGLDRSPARGRATSAGSSVEPRRRAQQCRAQPRDS